MINEAQKMDTIQLHAVMQDEMQDTDDEMPFALTCDEMPFAFHSLCDGLRLWPSVPDHAHASLKGSKVHNEDACLSRTVIRPFNTHPSSPAFITVLIVSDGHGINGEGYQCANYCVKNGNAWVESLYDKSRDWNTIDWSSECITLTAKLHNGYREECAYGDRRIVNGVVVDLMGVPIHSGATFSLAIVFPWNGGFRTVCVQVGDSEICVNGRMIPCNHSPTNPEEFARLQMINNAHRMTYFINNRYIDIYLPNGEFNPIFYDATNPAMPWKWSMGITPCCNRYEPSVYVASQPSYPYITRIACTRAIGDFYAHEGGITTIPHVVIMDHETHPIVCIASDGAWDTLDCQHKWVSPLRGLISDIEFTQFGKSEKTLQQSLDMHLVAIYNLARELFGSGVDDISMALVLP